MEKTTFEQELERKGNITYTCQGFSMLPLLRQQRDLFTITKKQDRCRKYDVALYKRADGAYVLHRIRSGREPAVFHALYDHNAGTASWGDHPDRCCQAE